MSEPASTSENRLFLSMKEAAYQAGVHISFLSRRIGKENGPPYRRRGRRVLFPRAKFMAWADQEEIP